MSVRSFRTYSGCIKNPKNGGSKLDVKQREKLTTSGGGGIQRNETAQQLEGNVGVDFASVSGFRAVRRWLVVNGTFLWPQILPGRPVLRASVWQLTDKYIGMTLENPKY
jgi:hypothetical protein